VLFQQFGLLDLFIFGANEMIVQLVESISEVIREQQELVRILSLQNEALIKLLEVTKKELEDIQHDVEKTIQ